MHFFGWQALKFTFNQQTTADKRSGTMAASAGTDSTGTGASGETHKERTNMAAATSNPRAGGKSGGSTNSANTKSGHEKGQQNMAAATGTNRGAVAKAIG